MVSAILEFTSRICHKQAWMSLLRAFSKMVVLRQILLEGLWIILPERFGNIQSYWGELDLSSRAWR
jgi:hypothetical protein